MPVDPFYEAIFSIEVLPAPPQMDLALCQVDIKLEGTVVASGGSREGPSGALQATGKMGAQMEA